MNNTTTTPISNTADIIYSSGVKARIADLARYDGLSDAERRELALLASFAEYARNNVPNWTLGVTMIRDSHFEDYAHELAVDLESISGDEHWPLNCIDWTQAAQELRAKYTMVPFDGVEYWTR